MSIPLRWIACGFLTLFISTYAGGQILSIDTIQISAPQLRSQNFGSHKQALPTSKSVAETLSDNTSVFLKNYGPGSLATSSIRGGSASHTLVLWNGLPIQNPFLGLLDLSLLDTWSMTSTTLQKGGNTAMWGSGAIGGVISMTQKNKEQSKMKLVADLSTGSFGRAQQRGKLSFNLGQFRFATSYSQLTANNDFRYQLSNGDEKKQTNAAQEQTTLTQDVYWTPNPKNEIALHYWKSNADRENPPTTVQSKSEAYQIDKSDRLSLGWKHFSKNNKFSIKAAYFTEELNFYDPPQRIESLTAFQTAIIDINNEREISETQSFAAGVSYWNTSVSSPANYASTVTEQRIAAFIRYQHKWLQLSGRQEVADRRLAPFIPSLAIEVPLKSFLNLKGKVSKNYRLPTLNDRFWEQVGNPDLLAESGWSEEITLSLNRSAFDASITGFNRIIDNWIQWTVLETDRFFKPYNLKRVWSRGLEFQLNYEFRSLKFSGSYNYVKSTNTKAVQIPKIKVGDQLYYTPVHSGAVQVEMKTQKYSFLYLQRFTGQTLGINEDLEAYTTGDFTCHADYKRLGLYARINNIWNVQYRIIERRPMPGINYILGIKLKIEKK